MKLSRDTWLGLGLLILLILVTVAAGIQETQKPSIPYLSTSNQPNGTLLLKLWLEELGFDVADRTLTTFIVPGNADIALVLQPRYIIRDEEWESLDTWVRGGGTLVVAGDLLPAGLAMQHYEFEPMSMLEPKALNLPQTPLMSSPPLLNPATAQSYSYLTTTRSDFVTHLAIQGQPALVSFQMGSGRVILSASASPFSNLSLKDPANAAVILNVIALAVRNETVWFDEWHHGIQASEAYGPDQWLRTSALGHALLFITGAVFLALILRGRLFGRPVPPPHELKRRGPLEHVTAIANLNRRAGHRSIVLRQYHNRLKRHLGRRYRLDPSLPDAEFVQVLARYNPALDQAALLELLGRLASATHTESDTIRLAAQAAEWINSHQ